LRVSCAFASSGRIGRSEFVQRGVTHRVNGGERRPEPIGSLEDADIVWEERP
jgi:hypothetical protein